MVGATGFEPVTTRAPSGLRFKSIGSQIEKHWISLDSFCRDLTQANAAFRAKKALTMSPHQNR